MCGLNQTSSFQICWREAHSHADFPQFLCIFWVSFLLLWQNTQEDPFITDRMRFVSQYFRIRTMTACCCGSGVRLCIVSESLCRTAERDMGDKGEEGGKGVCEEGLDRSPLSQWPNLLWSGYTSRFCFLKGPQVKKELPPHTWGQGMSWM